MVCRPTVMMCVRGGGVSCVASRAQLGRLGGSRWGWVLRIKFSNSELVPAKNTYTPDSACFLLGSGASCATCLRVQCHPS